MNNTTSTTTARIFEEADGFHYCSTASDILDARGSGFKNWTAATRAAFRAGFTHVLRGGSLRSIPSVIRVDQFDESDHRRSRTCR